MLTCPHCQQSIATRDGRDRHGRQRFACSACGRDFTVRSASAFSGYRWPADVILMAVRWYLRHALSATSVMELLAERGIDVSNRTVLRWVQTFGPQLAAEARQHRRPLGHCWYTDEMFFFRGKEKYYLYRAVDEHQPPRTPIRALRTLGTQPIRRAIRLIQHGQRRHGHRFGIV